MSFKMSRVEAHQSLRIALQPSLLDGARIIPAATAVGTVGQEEVGPTLLREARPFPVVRRATIPELVVGGDRYPPGVAIVDSRNRDVVIKQAQAARAR